MDRQIVYNGAIPLDVDQLNQSKNTMIGLGMALQALLGTGTLVDGLATTPTSPASLQVHVAPGSIYSYTNVDGTTFGSVAADTTHQIVKQGISLGTLTFTCPAPTTTGFSINYLVQAAYQDADTGATVLPYYNSSNPSVAYNGPGNSGTSQNTVRQGQCVVNVLAGTAATTGSQTTPAPTAGYTGLYVITVANGATTIISGNIAAYSGAPIISEKLGDKISIPTGDARYLRLGTGIRTKLSNNTTFYVNASTGSNSNNGTASGTPWQTLQYAFNLLANQYDLAGFVATIQLADGTYVGASQTQPWAGGGELNVVVNGNSTTPTNTVISSSGICLQAQGSGCGFTYQNLEMTSTGPYCVLAGANASLVQGSGVVFGSASAVHIGADRGGSYVMNGNYTIAGGATSHFYVHNNGSIEFSPSIVCTCTGSPSFSSQFALVQDNGTLFFDSGTSFSGSATGTRYLVSTNGVINTGTGNASFLPGSTSGSASTGGQYA